MYSSHPSFILGFHGCDKALADQVIKGRKRLKQSTNDYEKSFDSVRAVFWEGENLYPNAGFKEKNHIQVCIRNPNCIKGFFRVRDLNEEYPIP